MSLEKYYLDKKKASDEVKKKAVSEFFGDDELIKKKSPGFFIQLLDILDRPGNAVRALLVGKLGGLKGLLPFAQTIEDLTGIDVALNKDELVRGTEIVEKWFGKQRQRKGKIDAVDVYGLLLEIVADPLWLVGGVGLTKVGRAKGLIGSALKTANRKEILTAVRAARQGKTIPTHLNKSLTKAIRTVAKTKGYKLKSRSWAEQVAKGERALLKLGLPGHRKTVIKGAAIIAKAEKAAIKIRKGYIGQKFLAGTRRTAPKYEELHEIAVHLGRDVPDYKKGKWRLKLKDWFDRAKTAGIDEADITDFVEANYAGEPIAKLIKGVAVERAKIAKPVIRKGEKKIAGLIKRKAETERKIKIAGAIAKREKPIPQRLPTVKEIGVAPEIRGFGKPAKPIPKGRIKRLALKHKEKIKQKNLLEKQRYEKLITADKARATKRVALVQRDLKGITNEIGRINNKISRVGKLTKADKTKIAALQAKGQAASQRADEILSELKPQQQVELRALAENYHQSYKTMLEKAQGLGIPQQELARAIGYAPRVPTEDFMKWLKKNPRYGSAKDFSVRSGFQVKRKAKWADWPREKINEYFRKLGYTGDDVFQPSIAESALVRAGAHEDVIGSAKTIHAAIKRFGKKAVPEGEDWIPVNSFIKETGLKIPKGENIGRFIPSEVANRLTELHKLTFDDEFLTGLGKINQMYKGFLTIYWPAYHGRNAISNVALNWIEGVKNPVVYFKAMQLQKAARATRKLMQRTGQSWDETARTVKWPTIGNVPGHAFYEDAAKHGLLGRSLGEFGVPEIGTEALLKPKGRIKAVLTHQGRVGKAGRAAGITIENNARLAHAIDKTLKGNSIFDAAISAKKVLFDYSDLSRFEQKVLRDKTFLFYCVPTDCQILTRDGWKTYDQLKIDEAALGYDVKSGEAKWTTVQDIAVFDYNGVLMSITKLKCRAEWLFTPNHRWPVKANTTYGGKAKSTRRIVRGYQLRSNHTIPYSAPFNDWPKESMFTPREAAIIGWLITDGCMSGYKNHNWRIYQSPKKYANEIRNLLGDDGLKESVHPDSGVISFGVSAELRNTLIEKGFSGRKDAQHIVGRLSKEAAEAMWNAMYKADGTTSKNRTQDYFACQNEDVFDTAQILVQLFGKHMHRSQKGGYISQNQGQWCHVDRAGNLGTKWFSGKVWCPQTGTGTWVMRRNGKIIITGNTFARKNISLQVKTLAQQPAKQAFYSHLFGGTPRAQQEGKYLPDWQQEVLTVPTPFYKDGKRIVARGTGLPIEEAFGPIAGPGVGIPRRLSRIVSRQMARTIPAIRAPVELATGHELYFDRPIKSWSRWGSQQFPWARVSTTARSLTREGAPLGSKISSLMTGVRFQPQDEQRTKEMAIRDTVRKLLSGRKGVKKFYRYWSPDELNEKTEALLKMQK